MDILQKVLVHFDKEWHQEFSDFEDDINKLDASSRQCLQVYVQLTKVWDPAIVNMLIEAGNDLHSEHDEGGILHSFVGNEWICNDDTTPLKWLTEKGCNWTVLDDESSTVLMKYLKNVKRVDGKLDTQVLSYLVDKCHNSVNEEDFCGVSSLMSLVQIPGFKEEHI